jgi:hypothetical protein
MLRCIGCDQVLTVAKFTQIKGRPGAFYSRCRPCRAARARARYHRAPETRAAEIARALRNKRRRQQRAHKRDAPDT